MAVNVQVVESDESLLSPEAQKAMAGVASRYGQCLICIHMATYTGIVIAGTILQWTDTKVQPDASIAVWLFQGATGLLMARELAPIVLHLIKTFPKWLWYTPEPEPEYIAPPRVISPPRKPKMKPVGEPINLRQWAGQRSYRRGGYVYILKDVEISGYYKIGKTTNPHDRMKAFGIRLPFEAELIHVIACDNSHQIEYRLHMKFADKRKHGEWFALTDDDVNWLKLHHEMQ